MTTHTKDPLGCACVAQVFDLPLAIATSKAAGAERLVASQDREVFDLIAARAAAVGAIVTYKRAVAQEEEVRVGIEEGAAGIASETVDMPSIASCRCTLVNIPIVAPRARRTQFKGLALLQDLSTALAGIHDILLVHGGLGIGGVGAVDGGHGGWI